MKSKVWGHELTLLRILINSNSGEQLEVFHPDENVW